MNDHFSDRGKVTTGELRCINIEGIIVLVDFGDHNHALHAMRVLRKAR